MIAIFVATDNKGVIGRKNNLPWKLPADLAYFKKLTTGHPIIMGRKTHESVGRALPERTNIVVSRGVKVNYEGCEVVSSLNEAIQKAKESPGADQIFVIGGEAIYELALPVVDRIYLTRVNADIADGDKFFKFNKDEWREISVEQHSSDKKNQYDYEFTVLDRSK